MSQTVEKVESYKVGYNKGLPAYPKASMRTIELRVLNDRLELPADGWFSGLVIPYSAARSFGVLQEHGKKTVVSINYEDETGRLIRLELRMAGLRGVGDGKRLTAQLQEHIALAAVGDAALVCPHCQTRGSVTTKSFKSKKGISGGKATGAILTGGLSILATGLSRKENGVEAHCSACGATWHL